MLSPASPDLRTPTLLHVAITTGLLAALYAALAYGGIELTRGGGRIAALWLPNAVLAAAMLRTCAPRCTAQLVACFCADVAVNLVVHDTATAAVILGFANCMEVLIVVWTIRRLCGGAPTMDDLKNLGSLLLVCIVAPAMSALIAAVALAEPGEIFAPSALIPWILADGLGLMIVTPVMMIGIDAWRTRRRPQLAEILEWSVFVTGTIVAAALIFGQSRFPFLFLACPIVIVAAFRTGVRGTAVSITLISLVASIATMLGSGPIMLVRGDIADKLVALQLFLATSFAMGLPVAAALTGRDAIRRDLQTSRDLNRSILDNLREVVFKTDTTGRWIFLNPAWEDITGYPVEQSLGWATTKLLHEEDRLASPDVYARIASGDISETILQQRFFNAAGNCRHIEVTVRRLVDPKGRFAGTAGNIRDVSEKVRQDRALAESETRFRNIAEAAPVGIFVADAQGMLTYVNPIWCEKLGLSVEETLGNGWTRALVDPDRFEDDPAFTGFNKPGDVRRRITRFRAADGSDLWAETVNSAEFDEQGTITGFVGAIVDITEQRRATEKLVESERRFQALANLAPAGIFRTDADGRCTYVNDAWLRITGLEADDWQGEGWANALHPDDRNRVATGWAEAVAEQRDYRDEFRWVREDGECAWVDVLGRPELDNQGRVLGFIGVTMDITDRRRAEAELAARDEQLTLLANNATDAVVRLTLDGQCLYASPSTKDLLGIAPRHLVGQQMLDRFHPEDDAAVREAFRGLAAGVVEDEIIAYRSELMGQPGAYRWLEAHCGLVRDEADSPAEIICSIRDASKSKALQAELLDARARAETAAAAKAAFLANMSHEIRTPMNGVLGFTELLAGSALNPEQRRHVALIADSGRAMMRLLNDILDMSKIDSGQMRVAVDPVDIRHKLKACSALMEPIARAKGVALNIEIDPALPRSIIGDPLRLRQILLNLIGNAVKFTEHGSIVVRARRELRGDADLLLLEVVDSGPGIPADQLDVIFHQFSQADTSIARKFGGTGLGLSISSELAKLMGGEIVVDSTVGEGTTFTVRLPLVADEGAVSRKKTEAIATPALPTPYAENSPPPRVLIAEDHDINQALITALAKAAGMAPTIAENGEQAIAMVCAADDAGEPYALVLMDMQMPVVDGLEATRRLRALGFSPATLPIVALTANAYAEDMQACLAAGMQAHLAKPVRLRDLTDIKRRFLAVVSGTEENRAVEATSHSGKSLETRYRERRKYTLETVAENVRRGELSGEAFSALVDQLHKLAGTAGFFGDAALGDAASALERALLGAEPHDRASVLQQGAEQFRNAA